ncbi:IPExxxVDY family protein [Confluentibacter flavum]|uniref:IPExxxVDY family protein n=1 Tax=Confluentibacter flavum TaxID=1909700 RepID=A0A2N3HLS8_9FLAO|nr:IPExxxVDY family protein [Confluentibacter flavum]PKQ45920.1 IPExxxVDY family protein [Confluentibacter flavum]
MAVHKLILDDFFEEAPYTLIAIYCAVEDYRLAYLLNSYLKIRLNRKPSDLDYNNGKSNFSIFEWVDPKYLSTWNLVHNVCKSEVYQKANQQSLFDSEEKITKTFYLIPEYKQVNYFLKIDSEFDDDQGKLIIDTILKIPQISTAYHIDGNQLKSKNNLIFS